MSIYEWEDLFGERIGRTPVDTQTKAGWLLPCVPERAEWERFLRAVKESWQSVGTRLSEYPHLLLMLYTGVAFHDYKNNELWPQFSRAVGVDRLPANRQKSINTAFLLAVTKVQLRSPENLDPDTLNNYVAVSRSYVGLAVRYIGIPVSVWGGFLDICDWAVWHDGWNDLSDAEWKDTMKRRCGGRQRLLKFLTDNRSTASAFIEELLDARRRLNEDEQFSLSELVQTTNLRHEYFEEVPETAEFLQRPQELDSLLENRPRLLWHDNRIAIHLPPVKIESATWQFDGETKPAGDIATGFPINGKAFQEHLTLELHAGESPQPFPVVGLKPFGLFDEQKERFANIGRSRLPANSYRLVSSTPLDISARGWADWDEDDKNQPVELEDGTQVFVTFLWPISNRPTLKVNGGSKIEFGRRQRVNLRVFSGCDDNHVFRFALKDNSNLIMEQMPVLVLEVPVDFLPDEPGLLNREFRVFVDGRPTEGEWVFYEDYPKHPIKSELEYSTWKWAEDIDFPQGDYEIRVESSRVGILPFGTRPSQHVNIKSTTNDGIWPVLHDEKFWVWILLSQVQDDATWEEFWIARGAVAGFRNLRINRNDWSRLEEQGFVELGRKIEILQSRLAFCPRQGDIFVAHYAGLVNRLYSIVRAVPPVQQILVKQKRGLPPYLEVHWPASQRSFIRSICPREGIEIRQDSLWNR